MRLLFNLPSHTFIVFILLACGALVTKPVLAQEMTLDTALDLRAHLPSHTGDTSEQLHAGYFRLHLGTEEPQAIKLDLFGLNQYGAFRLQQASLEKAWGGNHGSQLPNRIQAGLLRLPFGIYDYRETYASGLIDYPLPRVDFAYNAVDWGVPGAQWSGGNASVQADVAAFSGRGVGIWGNIQHTEGVAGRTQFFLPPNLVLGISTWQGRLAANDRQTAQQSKPVHIAGADMRYTLSHLLLRGEFLAGEMPDAPHMRGAYLDAYYRLPGIEKVTLVGRVETLHPGDSEPDSHQITAGVRWTVTRDWMLAANWRRNNIRQAYSFTWTPPAEGRGDVLLQALYSFSLYHNISRSKSPH